LKKRYLGFTLIELLIVVAIIGILAAIAIPNFLQAQIRAKVAKAKSELRTLTTGIEAYAIDNNHYPMDGARCSGSVIYMGSPLYYWYVPNMVTTPIDYISSTTLIDPFREGWYKPGDALYPDRMQYERYRYMNIDDTWGAMGPDCDASQVSTYYDNMLCVAGHWAIHSLGPNRTYRRTTPLPEETPSVKAMEECGYPAWPRSYDPTNGTVSDGNIIRSSKKADHK
jgi:general secretion pathway protein G